MCVLVGVRPAIFTLVPAKPALSPDVACVYSHKYLTQIFNSHQVQGSFEVYQGDSELVYDASVHSMCTVQCHAVWHSLTRSNHLLLRSLCLFRSHLSKGTRLNFREINPGNENGVT